MNLFTELMGIDEAVARAKEEKKQQQLFRLGRAEQKGGYETVIPENDKNKLTPFAPGFGPWGW